MVFERKKKYTNNENNTFSAAIKPLPIMDMLQDMCLLVRHNTLNSIILITIK